MRELKFRAWWKDTKRFLDGDEWYMTSSGAKHLHYAICHYSDDDFIIEQYTGIKDKNGKEIYEGDIVDVIFPTKLRGVEEHQIWVCRFGIKRSGFVLNRETNARIFSLTFGEINAKNIAVEVIGNIHENANLLEDEE